MFGRHFYLAIFTSILRIFGEKIEIGYIVNDFVKSSEKQFSTKPSSLERKSPWHISHFFNLEKIICFGR